MHLYRQTVGEFAQVRRREPGVDARRDLHVIVPEKLAYLVHRMPVFRKPYGGTMPEHVR